MATAGKATANRGGRKARAAAEQPAAAETPKQPARRGRGKAPATPVPPTTFRTADGEALAQPPTTHPIDGAPVKNGARMKAPTRKRAAPVTSTPPNPATKIAASALSGGDESRFHWVDSNTVIIVN